jgi:hypothetical protein
VSQRIAERAGRSIAGRGSDPCPPGHPIVGHLRCGEWPLLAAVDDLVHVGQPERLEAGS